MMSRSVAALVALLVSAALASAQWYPGQTAQPAPSAPLEGNDSRVPSAQTTSRPGGSPTAAPDLVEPASPFAPPILDGDSPDGPVTPPAGPRLTIHAEYLMWWLKADRPALPLLTTGGAGGGALNAPDTTVLFRLSDLDKDEPYSGGRIGFSFWFDPHETLGVDVDGFVLQKRTFQFAAGSNAAGEPLLSVPYFDVNPAINGPSFTQISVPGILVGHVDASYSTQLWGIVADFQAGLLRSGSLSVDGLLGFRQADLLEHFDFNQNVQATVGVPLLSFNGNLIPASDSLAIADSFHTQNLFYGCDVGLRTKWQPFADFEVDLTTRIALGATNEKLAAVGSTSDISGGHVVQTAPGGLFALWGANGGDYSHYRFAVIPATELRVRYAVTNWLAVSVGGDVLYWSSVVRPADQVSGTLNSSLSPSQVPFNNGGPALPRATLTHTDFSAQGFNVGVELRF